MATQINPILNSEVLDHALVQCLRLFAQHGRKVRNQKLPIYEGISDILKTKNNPENSNGEDADKK